MDENSNILSFADAFVVAEYAISTMQCCGARIINSTSNGSTLSPQGVSTRAQLAMMLFRWLA